MATRTRRRANPRRQKPPAGCQPPKDAAAQQPPLSAASAITPTSEALGSIQIHAEGAQGPHEPAKRVHRHQHHREQRRIACRQRQAVAQVTAGVVLPRQFLEDIGELRAPLSLGERVQGVGRETPLRATRQRVSERTTTFERAHRGLQPATLPAADLLDDPRQHRHKRLIPPHR